MSLITFRDRNTKGDPVGPIWYLEFDALTLEEFTRDADVTQYPVETGAILSDHYQPQPRQISLLGVVSDTPSRPGVNLEDKQNAAAPPNMVTRPLELDVSAQELAKGKAGIRRPIVTGILPSQRLIQGNIERARLFIPKFALTLQVVNGSSFAPSGVTRIASFRQVIDGLMETRTQVDVVMHDGIEYKNMFITSARAPRVAGRGGSVTFALDLQEVIFAKPTTTIEWQGPPAEAKNEPKVNGGRGNPKPPEGKELTQFEKDGLVWLESGGFE